MKKRKIKLSVAAFPKRYTWTFIKHWWNFLKNLKHFICKTRTPRKDYSDNGSTSWQLQDSFKRYLKVKDRMNSFPQLQFRGSLILAEYYGGEVILNGWLEWFRNHFTIELARHFMERIGGSLIRCENCTKQKTSELRYRPYANVTDMRKRYRSCANVDSEAKITHVRL